ncbi:efflux RND transporter periplasmic adaptor subunit [Chryseobacterium sp.]|uniref:efflux RND transporter periplasmic adaptor subunit n=1 Tax=Chryseobacterium sp. TaxID=1871047 RepID=UPI0025C4F0E8|nr:efflux RND transporter periplasmic adaptor subunit [Chryseobacterium sp.]
MNSNNIFLLLIIFLSFSSCKDEAKEQKVIHSPIVSKDGINIRIPDPQSANFFTTETAGTQLISADLIAPAQIVATSINNNMVVFSNPELTSNYSELLNHRSAIAQKQAIVKQKEAVIKQKEAIIRQKQIEIDRFLDLARHGSATGKDVADARTDKLLAESEKSIAQSEKASAEADLIAEKSLIIEHTSILKSAGFNPDKLINNPAKDAWIIADISENQINKIKTGAQCTVKFTSYPNETFTGTISGIADVMDNISRMTKVRIIVNNNTNKLRAGMFATVSFEVSEGDFINIDKNSVITVQGKSYVFIKKSPSNFERREIITGQQIGDRIVIFDGIENNEQVVNNGSMQLKGLSFGY